MLAMSLSSNAQSKGEYGSLIIIDGDTIPHIHLSEIIVRPMPDFESRRYAREYWRLVQRVKKTYPYAVMVANLFREYENEFRLSDKSNKERKKYLKKLEDELFAKYSDELKKMSINDGRILIKLIDRETRNTSYFLIKDIKGGASAFFWQGIAKLFGNNLKTQYNPKEVDEDAQIERILLYMRYNLI